MQVEKGRRESTSDDPVDLNFSQSATNISFSFTMKVRVSSDVEIKLFYTRVRMGKNQAI